jgi:hypothetical protein
MGSCETYPVEALPCQKGNQVTEKICGDARVVHYELADLGDALAQYRPPRDIADRIFDWLREITFEKQAIVCRPPHPDDTRGAALVLITRETGHEARDAGTEMQPVTLTYPFLDSAAQR